jgi:glutamyl-tRNA reductase
VVIDLGIPAQVRVPDGAADGPLDELRVLSVDELCEQGRPPLEPEALALADEIVELGVEDFLRAHRVGRQARVLRAAQESRRRTTDEELPALLDRHAPELGAASRRRLVGELRQLMSRQHRALLQALDHLAGLSASEDAP